MFFNIYTTKNKKIIIVYYNCGNEYIGTSFYIVILGGNSMEAITSSAAVEKYCKNNAVEMVALTLYSGCQIILIATLKEEDETGTLILEYGTNGKLTSIDVTEDALEIVYGKYKSKGVIRGAWANEFDGPLSQDVLHELIEEYSLIWKQGLKSLRCNELVSYLSMSEISYFAFINLKKEYEVYLPLDGGYCKLYYPSKEEEASTMDQLPYKKMDISYEEEYMVAISKNLFSSSSRFSQYKGENVLSMEALKKIIIMLKGQTTRV